MYRSMTLALLFSLALVSTAAMADDWTAAKLRGNVLALDGINWVHLQRGDIVSDSRVIRTLADGNVQFTRDGETIDVGGNSQIQIHDRSGQRFTTVNEAFGKVSIEANVENVKHFAVQTPFIAAVVKGTIFTVTSGKVASEVEVNRGKVGVEDLHAHNFVDVLVGQHASAGQSLSLSVGGTGTLQPITNANGKVISVITPTGESIPGPTGATLAPLTAAAVLSGQTPSNSGNTQAGNGGPGKKDGSSSNGEFRPRRQRQGQ